MTVFRALRKHMLRLRSRTRRVKFRVDELYVNAGLKDRCNSRIKRLGRRLGVEHLGGVGLWMYDKQAIFILVGGDEGCMPSAVLNLMLRIIGGRVQKDSQYILTTSSLT